MKQMFRTFLAVVLLGSWLQLASAQDAEPSDLVRGGLQAIQMIDQNKTGELWDGATPAARKRVSRDEFVSQVAKARAPLGAAQQRTWVAVNRQVVGEGNQELAGQYVSIEYETRFANKANATMRELVTFQLGDDRVWRFSGYVLR
jgi:predicted secreted protein